MKKVASYFTLKEGNITLFNLWIATLPETPRASHKDKLWQRAKRSGAILWTERNGFQFF